MSYIKEQQIVLNDLTCIHPKVKQLWTWGATSINRTSDATFNIGILLKDGARHDFSGATKDEAVAAAEKFLENL